MVINHYDTLNISRESDKAAIKRAYFSLVKICTPDKDPVGFRRLRDAYDTLSDDKKRAEYDAIFTAPDILQNELITARDLIRQAKLKQAIPMLMDLLKKNPDSPDVKRLLVDAYLNNGNTGKAQKLCDEILSDNPNDQQAMLLLAKSSAMRKYTFKATEQFEKAVNMNPLNPEPWLNYLYFLLNEMPYMVPDVTKAAMAHSEDMFRDDYTMYIKCAVELIECGEKPDALKCLVKFKEYFLADKHQNYDTFGIAINCLTFFLDDKEFSSCVAELLPVLQESGFRRPEHNKILNQIKGYVSTRTLDNDKRIGEDLFDLTVMLIEGCGCEKCKMERLSLQCAIISELESSRKQVMVLRDEYPEFYNLNQEFYFDVLSTKKVGLLMNKYSGNLKKMISKVIKENAEKGFGPIDDFEDFEDLIYSRHEDSDVYDADDQDQPYALETPKVGRNDPCPCGSGKKYKKCCGA